MGFAGMPYYLGGEIKDFNKLQITTPASLYRRFNLNVHVHKEATATQQLCGLRWRVREFGVSPMCSKLFFV